MNAGSSHRLPVCGGGTSQGDLPPSGPVWQYPGVCLSLHQVSSERKKASHFCPHTSQRGHCLPPEVSERLSPVIRYSDTDRQRETSCQSTTRAVTTSTWNIVDRHGRDSDVGVIPGRFEDGRLRIASANKLTEARQSDVNYKQIATGIAGGEDTEQAERLCTSCRQSWGHYQSEGAQSRPATTSLTHREKQNGLKKRVCQ